MAACKRHEEELALLAGGDLVSESRAAELGAHVAACEGCRDLLQALEADHDAFAVLGAGPGSAEGLHGEVLARLAASPASHFGAASRQIASRSAWSSPAGWSAAAGVLVVVLAGAVGLGRLTSIDAEARLAGVSTAGNAGAELSSVPVQVRRAPGDAVELSWQVDGRQNAYHVLASSSPSEFSGAQRIDVAGGSLVATTDLPTRRMGATKVTYFRVQ